MNRFFWGTTLLIVPWLALSGCQSIPARPLALEESLQAWKSREIAPEPVLDFAARLDAARDTDGAPFDAADGLALHEAEAVALWYNPMARIRRLEAEQAATLAEASGRWADPGLEFSGGRKREESEAPRGIERSWISASSLSITIPLSGRSAAERRARSAEHQAAMLAVAEQEWLTLKALREAWLAWSAAVERLQLLDAHLAVIGSFTDVARALAQAGELDPGTARMFSIERALKQAQRDSATPEAEGLRTEVLSILGLVPDAPIELLPAMDTAKAPAAPELDAFSLALRHPAVARLAGDYASAEARLRLELRKQYPDLSIAPAYTDEGGESSIVLGLGLMPIPVWNANRPGIAEAVAVRDLARARAESMAQQVIAERIRAEARLAAGRALREGLAQGAAPEADLQMAEAQALLRAGEADMGMVFQALTQAYGIKRELLDATLEEQLAIVELDAMRTPSPLAPFDVEVAP